MQTYLKLILVQTCFTMCRIVQILRSLLLRSTQGSACLDLVPLLNNLQGTSQYLWHTFIITFHIYLTVTLCCYNSLDLGSTQ